MYEKIVVLKRNSDQTGSITLGFFDKNGILQLEVPQISQELFPAEATKGKEVVFTTPAKVIELKK